MTYLAITQGTADWLLGRPGVLETVHRSVRDTDALAALKQAEFVEGPFRLATTIDGKDTIAAFWNVDYLSGRGEELWGFVRLDGACSINDRPDIAQEVLERCVYVVNQRLQGLLLDGAYIHRAHANGAHTCLAGRGSVARQVSIGYFEISAESAGATSHALVIVGPAYDFGSLAREAERAGEPLAALVHTANTLVASGRRKQHAPSDILPELRGHLEPFSKVEADSEYRNVEVKTKQMGIDQIQAYQALKLNYDEWVDSGSPLRDLQRRILLSNAVERHPLRIIGPGGSGKTLLMQLLAIRQALLGLERNRISRILYIAHNESMAEKVRLRFQVLVHGVSRGEEVLTCIYVSTLLAYGRKDLGLETAAVVYPDAEEAKAFQFDRVGDALTAALGTGNLTPERHPIFHLAFGGSQLYELLVQLVASEISISIKGHGLESDKRRYVQTERPLSRFHGLLSAGERELVFDAFQIYHREVFEELEVLDTDDVALSLLGRLRTPVWELRRKKLGFDYVFVDETQLFNENERRVLPYLSNGGTDHVPIVLALDEAQDLHGQSTAGFATLGIPNVASESLDSIYRSTKDIVRLAFFVIQRTTDLFGPDFPDFTRAEDSGTPSNHPLAAPPTLEREGGESKSLGRYVLRRVRELRRSNIRQIAVICHVDAYWDTLLRELSNQDLPLQVLTQRGAKLPVDQPLVVLAKPSLIGGQEVDAVVLVGLEQGLTPPSIPDNDALGAAVEQQAYREIYLALTRARYRVVIVLSAGAAPTAILQEAAQVGLLQ